METSLLEFLKEQIGCLYLSDLPMVQYHDQIILSLEKLKLDSFPLKEWNDAVSYITKEQASFQTAQAALEYLKHHK